MKRIIYTILITMLIFIPFKIYATDYSATINGDSVRIRSEANTNSSIIVSVNSGTKITVINKTLYEGTGCSDKWYKVNYNDKTGYVCSTYVKFTTNTYNGINVVDWTARINANNVNVRSGTSTSYSILDKLSLGTNVTIKSTVSGSSTNCSSGKWYKIQYYGSKTGYICKGYVTTKDSITATDSEYSEYLKKAGFPDSYIPYLTYLHKKYPNWIFRANKTNISFTTAVSNESGKNYMQTTNDYYRTSSTPSEGSSWYNVNKGVIAFYLDPRNWLTKKRIFMFEKLDYTSDLESKYPNMVKAIFSSGKLSDDKYTQPIVKAGKTNSISPVHIASRIRQEVSINGSDSTNGTKFTWKGKTYSGYYNFFNIGAYEVTIDGIKYSAVTRGLAYAAKLVRTSGSKWNTIETAIVEGSEFLADGYINNGQQSLYYQKFNVGPNAYYSKYTHQYMTNIQAPALEAGTAATSYSDAGTLNEPFVFDIPIYNNMPEYTSLPKSGDTNNDLKSLSISNFSISPSFDKDILTYTAYVPDTTNKIIVNATASSSKATVTGNKEIELPSDENIVTISVTSETGEEKKYNIAVTKVEDNLSVNDVINKLTYELKDSYLTLIKDNTTVSTLQNKLMKSGALSVKVTNNNTSVAGSSLVATGQKITIKTITDTKTFTISVKGDTSGDGKVTILDLLQIQKHIKGDSKLTGAYKLSGDTSGDSNVTILDLLQVQKHIKGVKKL